MLLQNIKIYEIPMEKICGVYKITSPSGKVYIGSSKDIYDRWKTYKKVNCKKQTKLYNSLKKYGFENHKFEVLGIYLKEDLLNWEHLWCLEYDACSKNNLNCISPKFYADKCIISEETKLRRKKKGENRVVSLETRKKMSLSLKKRYEDPNERLKTSLAMKKIKPRKHSQETKLKMSLAHKGKKPSKEALEKRSKALKGRIFSKEHRQKLKNVTTKIVLNTETGIFYPQIQEAALAYGIKKENLYDGIKRKSKKYEKFIVC
jgi:group I intron endonuclease